MINYQIFKSIPLVAFLVVFSCEDKNDVSDNSKKLLEGMKVADGQIKLQSDNLKVLEVGRQSMGLQLKELLKNETPLED